MSSLHLSPDSTLIKATTISHLDSQNSSLMFSSLPLSPLSNPFSTQQPKGPAQVTVQNFHWLFFSLGIKTKTLKMNPEVLQDLAPAFLFTFPLALCSLSLRSFSLLWICHAPSSQDLCMCFLNYLAVLGTPHHIPA